MMFEADGGQSASWQGGPPGTPPGTRYPNIPNTSLRRQGALEGVPRLLDMFERRGVRVSSYMIGATIERYPELAKEIVERGHEGGGRGRLHVSTHWMPKDRERAWFKYGLQLEPG